MGTQKEKTSFLLRFIQMMRPISAVLLPNMIGVLTAITKGYLSLTVIERTWMSSILSFAIIFCWIFGGGEQYMAWIKDKWLLIQKIQQLDNKEKKDKEE